MCAVVHILFFIIIKIMLIPVRSVLRMSFNIKSDNTMPQHRQAIRNSGSSDNLHLATQTSARNQHPFWLPDDLDWQVLIYIATEAAHPLAKPAHFLRQEWRS